MEDPSYGLSTHQCQKKKKAMEKTNDRISQLPDYILHDILSLMPMKFVLRTSILSRRWRNLWKYILAFTTVLDFGVEFATGQTTDEFMANVNRYLQLHKGNEIQMFRLSFIRRNLSDAEKWVKFAIARGVKELDIDFSQIEYDQTFEPELCKSLNSIFSCDSITHLNLSRCDLWLPLNFKGCNYLKTLHLSHVAVTDVLFESMLSNCPVLEELSLRDCHDLTRVKVSAPDLPLKSLTVVDCLDADEIEIFAPNLRSFHFYGDFIDVYFKNISSLVDVLVNGIARQCYESDWITVLQHLEHVKIMTLCNVSLECVALSEDDRPRYLPVTFHKLQELQLLMDWHGRGYLACTYSFFRNCPCPYLEKLFIELRSAAEKPLPRAYLCERLPPEDPLEVVFDHLKVIKMNGFRGLEDEMRLVKFFLEKAISLESLVLVAPQEGVCDMEQNSSSETESVGAPLALLERLLILWKASSSDARILMCEYSDDYGALAPAHTEVFRKG